MPNTDESAVNERDTLRSLAEKRGFKIGTAVDMRPLASEPRYTEVLLREFNTVVAENAYKPKFVWLGPGKYRFDEMDRLAAFARDHGLALRGHTLIWHQSLPTWLQAGRFSAQEIKSYLRDYIHAVVGRFRGQVREWDVVNEAIADGDSPGFRENSFWFESLGPEYIDLAFQWAREADPDVRLYYNDYEAEDMGPKANAVYQLAKDLLARGVPIDGVGLQCHLINGWRASDENRENIRRIAALGLAWQVTEADIRIQLDGKPATEEQLALQANGYRDLMELCLAEPNCKGFLCWGLADCHSWIPGFRQGWGAGLPLDDKYRPKPAYHAIQQALQG